ncbi:ANTAR domain-containing protein [Modestobacter sp. NPDC049651]|uniref:ANTAR domain-containing protein n=1 Tax=unclassified Modestobacter TaxID=2643866 RepID=UPI0033C54029
MTVVLPVELMATPAEPPDVLTLLDELQERARSAEDRAAGLERALASNRRIGMAIGILMCQRRLTEEQAFAVLRTHSQHRNVKVRELAETVIYTGRL